MGVWTEQVVPRVVDLGMRGGTFAEVRERVCAGLHGDVVELGFGSGLNVPHYPPAVRQVAAVEPSEVGWKLAARRVAASPVPVTRAGLDGQMLPFADDTFDSALSTWTLCTIPDAVQALREVRRVLKPGGRLHFLEHGLAPEPRVARWQRRLTPLNRRLAGGCHLDRAIDVLVREAGLQVERLRTWYLPMSATPYGFHYEGVATA